AVMKDTQFHDLPAVQNAIFALVNNPTDPIPALMIKDQIETVVPASVRDHTNEIVSFFLDCIRTELYSIQELQGTLSLHLQQNILQTEERVAIAVEQIAKNTTPAIVSLEPIRRRYLDYVIKQCGSLNPRGISQTVKSVTLPL